MERDPGERHPCATTTCAARVCRGRVLAPRPLLPAPVFPLCSLDSGMPSDFWRPGCPAPQVAVKVLVSGSHQQGAEAAWSVPQVVMDALENEAQVGGRGGFSRCVASCRVPGEHRCHIRCCIRSLLALHPQMRPVLCTPATRAGKSASAEKHSD